MTDRSPRLFPNRKLGFSMARTAPEDECAPNALAAVALANIRPGETVPVRGNLVSVTAVTEASLAVALPDGRKRRIAVASPAFDQLLRDVYGLILGHSVIDPRFRLWPSDEPDVVKALRRDPACHLGADGILRLRDPKPLPPLTASAASWLVSC